MYYVIRKTLSDIDGQMENESWINVLLTVSQRQNYYFGVLVLQVATLTSIISAISKSIYKILHLNEGLEIPPTTDSS